MGAFTEKPCWWDKALIWPGLLPLTVFHITSEKYINQGVFFTETHVRQAYVLIGWWKWSPALSALQCYWQNVTLTSEKRVVGAATFSKTESKVMCFLVEVIWPWVYMNLIFYLPLPPTPTPDRDSVFTHSVVGVFAEHGYQVIMGSMSWLANGTSLSLAIPSLERTGHPVLQ